MSGGLGVFPKPVLLLGRRAHVPRVLLPFTTATTLLAAILVVGLPSVATADCPGRDDAIETDRPDVTNSSLVVARGRVQVENGVNWAMHQGAQILDGSETRVRVGAFRCGELLVDLPNYNRSVTGSSSSEFSELVVSAKRQMFIQSPTFSLSVTAGVGVPGLGTQAVDRRYTPYIQVLWSRSITDDGSVNGMVTVTWSTVAKTAYESILVIEREFGRGGAWLEVRCDTPTRQSYGLPQTASDAYWCRTMTHAISSS